NGHTTTYEYNILDQRVKTLFHDGSSLQETFDALDRRLSSIDQAGRVTQYAYDKLGRLIAVTDALNNVTSFTYDQAGNKLTQKDAEGRTTRWTYDAMGRVLTRTLPMGQMESFSYDVAGRLLSHTDFNSQTTAYTYDVNDQVSRIDYADGEVETFTYNTIGARLTATNSLGTTSYQYDALNRLVEETQPTGAVLSYSYDKAGNKTSATVTYQGKAETTTYLYDALNRLSKVIDPQGGETLYAYDAVGNRESVTQANGQTTTYVYDALNRLTRQTTTDAADNVIADYRYTLHNTGRREQIEELHNGRVLTYTYDALYRLTHDAISNPANGDYSAEYRFDKVGNRIYSIIDGVHTAYSYDDNDRLTQQGGVTYAYDANGNTLTETEDGLVSARYTYSAKNKLLAVTKAGETTSFGYNPDGIRTRKAASGSTTDFIVDQNRDYAQVLQEVVNGAKQVSYVYGDDLLSQARAGDVSYYVYDGQGSVRSLTNQTGVQTDSYHYDAFGILLHSEGDTPNSYLYTGEQYDASLDQYYLRARYYDQNQGRFTQMDTWMGINSDPVTLHKYLYANADPGNMVDPSGNFSLGELGAAMDIRMSLSGLQIDVGFSFLDVAIDPTNAASNLGQSIASSAIARGALVLLRFGGGKIINLLSRKTKNCFSNSFVEGTLVLTEDGYKSIESIEIGDFVFSYNEASSKVEPKEVVYLIRSEKKAEFVTIRLEDGSELISTPEHPYFKEGKWIEARHLSKGDILKGILEGIEVVSVSTRKINYFVYNFSVSDNHSYYVGEEGVLVHNASPVCAWLSANAKETSRHGLINSNEIRFSQDSISENFTNGTSVRALRDKLKKGGTVNVPPIRIFEADGVLFTLDNRRLWAYRNAGVPIETRPATAAEIDRESWKFTTRNRGKTIMIR
ncbi:polymorphic toxin-type HINT domain-containing protein, partial [Hahella sp. HN01]|uniref:polymorphic toxin-type HINT domain-containing protein n=1 Tax=Hahella sp. HN01 TaxID=2847262 RepID=UPI0020A65475